MRKKILIFGGSGFIGINLIKELIKSKDIEVSSASRLKGLNKKREKKIHYIKCDLSKRKDLEVFNKQKFDTVINLSGNINHKNKSETFKIHNEGSKNLFNFFAKKKIKLFIQIGTSLEYGNSKPPHTEGLRCEPKSFYGKSKLLATKHIEKSAKKKNVKYIILRLYQVYGPHQKFDRLIPFVIKNSLLNKKFSCSPGDQLRDFLFVDDLTALISKIINNSNFKSGIYNVGYGESIEVRKVIKNINQIIKKGYPLFGKIKMRKDENHALFPNIKKVKKTFKWRPKINLTKGLRKTINFYAKQI